MTLIKLSALTASIVMMSISAAFADIHTAGVPELNSRPGATYTVYLDPAGFNYPGDWGSDTPGNNLGLNDVPNNGTFGAADITEIKAIWAAMANQYRSFNVNVTTVDPYLSQNDPTPTDLERRDYYDSQTHMMHTIIGAGDGWQGTADGLAQLGTIGPVAGSPGDHTNWMFSNAHVRFRNR